MPGTPRALSGVALRRHRMTCRPCIHSQSLSCAHVGHHPNRPETQEQSTEAQRRGHSDGTRGQEGACCRREYGAKENSIQETEAIRVQDHTRQPGH